MVTNTIIPIKLLDWYPNTQSFGMKMDQLHDVVLNSIQTNKSFQIKNESTGNVARVIHMHGDIWKVLYDDLRTGATKEYLLFEA